MTVTFLVSKGGVLMYPLILCSVLLFMIFFERLWFFMRNSSDIRRYDEAKSLVQRGRIADAREVLERGRGPLELVFIEVLDNMKCSRHDLEHIVSNKGIEELQKFSRNLHIMELIGRIAPMLGLSGTVVGMVSSFHAVASNKGAVDASLLAGGIWESLLTTVAGLFVGIPALIIYHFFERKLNQKAINLKIKGEEIVRLFGVCG